MNISTILAIYFLIWWITLFAVLPFGLNRQAEESHTPGADPGAPLAHVMWRKLGWTTVVATIIFAIMYAGYAAGLFQAAFEWLMTNFGPPVRY
ncbi:MAG TPA: DUF1467 family protein [Pseudolabrys sp.]|jgi:predicted secreted protein